MKYYTTIKKNEAGLYGLIWHGLQKRQFGGWGDVLGVWDGNPITLDCDDHCTTLNVINSLSNKKKKNNYFEYFVGQLLHPHFLGSIYSWLIVFLR